MNGTPSTWLNNTSLPASNPASTEFDSTGQFEGPSTGTHYGSRQDYVGSVEPWAGQRSGDRLLHGVPLLSVPPAPVHLHPADHRSCAGRRFQQQCDRRLLPEGRLQKPDRRQFRSVSLLRGPALPPPIRPIRSRTFRDRTSTIPGRSAAWSFVGAKNTWGKDEITDIIGKGGTSIRMASCSPTDGFSLNVLGATTPSVPTVAFQGVTTGRSKTLPPNIFHQSSNPNVPQQIPFDYDVLFANPASPPFRQRARRWRRSTLESRFSVQMIPATTELFFTVGGSISPQCRPRSQQSGICG